MVASINENNELIYQLGNNAPKYFGGAHSTQWLGTVFINTKEGMVHCQVNVPVGVTSVNSRYVMSDILTHGRGLVFSAHTEGDNVLTLGDKVVAHSVVPGCVLITTPESAARFDGPVIPGKKVVIPHSQNFRYNPERDEVVTCMPSRVRLGESR